MLPSKIKALNDCSDSESSNNEDAPVKITKEALETKAEIQYSQALQCIARDQLDKAEEHLTDLLQSDIISSLNTTLDQKDKSQSLLTHLKYCCLTNLGNILLKKLNYSEALAHYQKALIMDSSDLNLWYRIGFAHTKLYQTDQAISAFLEGIKCNPNHWPTLDKLITLLYATNEYVSCLYHISKSLNLDSGYLKGHFIKEIIFNKFPSLITYFKSYCSDGGLDIKCSEKIDEDMQKKILYEIDDLKRNDPALCAMKKLINLECNPLLYAKLLAFRNWEHLGGWLLQIYDNIFENYDHSFLYEPIEFTAELSQKNSTNGCINVDEKYIESNFEKPSFKSSVSSAKRRKSSPTFADQLKLSRRSARNKPNSKVNESMLVKSIWNIIPQYLLINNDGTDKLNMNSIKWSDDSMDTMDLFRLFEFSDMLSDGPIENLLKNNVSNVQRLKQTNYKDYFGSSQEKLDLNNFIKLSNNKSICELLNMFLITIANKSLSVWPSNIVQVYICVFKRVWIHSNKQCITCFNSDPNLDSHQTIKKVKDEIISVLTYGELLCDLYFQLKVCQKPLDGSIMGGEFCTLWIGSIDDALSTLDLKDEDNRMINMRFLWLRTLFNIQDREIGVACDLLNTLLDFIGNNDDFEIILPNLEYFYQINKTITEKLVITLNRNNLLNTVKELYDSKEFLSVVDILKETLKLQSHTFIEIPSYPTMSRNNQYKYILKSFLELKNYGELFKWCESCLYESILQYRKSVIEESVNQKTNQTEFINNIFYAMIEAIKVHGLNVFDNLSQRHKSRLIQSVINLLSYLIESPDGNLDMNVVYPWLLIYSLLKHEEFKNAESLSSNFSSIPASLSLLLISHEYLGKRSWCCYEDGILLFLTLSEIEPYINSDLYALSLYQQVDQIFYCLYTHLIKRNKPRYVLDHNTMGLALTWSRAIQLVNFHYPSELPSYDGLSKAFTISSDTEIIFKKVIALIPKEMKPNRLLDDFIAYIKGETSELPLNENHLPGNVKDIFYLMADYSFKNKIWNKAIHYYLLDLCNNADRFDSWAAMALACGSQIETKLNSCETIKNESEIIKKAHMAGRCYKHSLKLSPENTTLLIEYGTLSYSIHSFCSRILKQETSNMSLQIFGELESEKEAMIKIAKKCFQTANDVWDLTNCESQDERWMHYYILGKIAEKNDDNLTLFLDHYLKAIRFLDSYGAIFPNHIIYTTPQLYSIEILEVYYRIHAGVLKLIEKFDCQSFNKELYTKIKKALEQVSNMSPIIDKQKKTDHISGLDYVNTKYDGIKKDSDWVVKQTLNDVVNLVTECDKNRSIGNQNKLVTDNSKTPPNEITVTKDSTSQQMTKLRWELIQKCIAALEDCIRRFPQHYKSYYRLAHFYFRSPYKDYKKFKDLMFGEHGLFGGQKSNNFFHGVWRIPASEIDRPGSFAYHMSRCIHLLLDFLKETDDHKKLLDLAIQLKSIPNLEKKYVRDNEREDISKEALFLSIQILRKLQSEYAKTNDVSKNEFLLIEVYKSYKRVFKCWQQKDNSLSKLLLNVYQNIVGTKEDVSNDIIIKHCLKLQAKEKEMDSKISHSNYENNVSSMNTTSKFTCKLDNAQAISTSCSSEVIKQLNSQQISHAESLMPKTQSIMSLLAPTYASSSSLFPLSSETSYSNTLQQKLQATKQKLNQIGNKPKIESKKLTNNKSMKIPNSLPNGRPVKNAIVKSKESKIAQREKLSKSLKALKSNNFEFNKFVNPAHVQFNQSVHNADSPVEIKLLQDKSTHAKSSTTKLNVSDLLKSPTIKQNMLATGVTISKVEPNAAGKGKVFSHSPKSVYINLDSAAEQARLKSTILHTKSLEKKNPLPPGLLNPAMLLSSCPGLSITPIVNNKVNHTSNKPSTSCQIQNPRVKCGNFQQLGNSVTITKTEKK